MANDVSAFLEAADWFCDLAGREDAAAGWAEKSVLAGLSVGGLVAHVAAGVAWLEPLLKADPPGDGRPVLSAGQYYQPFMMTEPDDLDGAMHVAVREQAEGHATRGPADTVASLRARTDRIRGALTDTPGGRLLDLRPTLPVAIPLGDFLATRIVELVVHGDDLAASLGVPADPPSGPAGVAVATLVAAARTTHGDGEVIRALARRERTSREVFPVL